MIALAGIGRYTLARQDAPAPPGSDDTVELTAADLKAFFDPRIERLMEEEHVPGLAITIVKDGQVVLNAGYGFANLDARTPIDPDRTVFSAASITKVFTSTAVMQLVEEGRISLDDAAAELVTDLELRNGFEEPIRLHHLLTHTAGFDAHNIGIASASADGIIPLGEYVVDQVPKRIAVPGEHWRYSNYSYALVGRIIEVASGKPYDEYLREHVLEPLGMESSAITPADDAITSRLATGYRWRDGGFHPDDRSFFLHAGPAGGLITTAADMGRFMIARLEGGELGDNRILRAETIEAMNARQFGYHPKLSGWTYGMQTSELNGRRVLTHAGTWLGIDCTLLLAPDDRLGVFIWTNSRALHGQLRLIREFYDEHYAPAPQTASPAQNAAFDPSTLVGSYRHWAFSRTSFEKLMTMFQQIQITQNDGGDLIVYGLADGPVRLEPVEPGLLHVSNNSIALVLDPYIAYTEDENGRVACVYVGTRSLYRLRWFETRMAQFGVLGLFAVAGVSWWIALARGRLSRNNGDPPEADLRRPRGAAGVSAALATLLGLFFISGLMAIVMIDPVRFLFGMPLAMYGLIAILVVCAVMSLLSIVFTVRAWISRQWSIGSRLHYSFVTAACVLLIVLCWSWELQGIVTGLP